MTKIFIHKLKLFVLFLLVIVSQHLASLIIQFLEFTMSYLDQITILVH